MPHIPIRESPPEIEQKTTQSPVQLRAAGGASRRIGGYGAVFECRSEPLPFLEVVDRRFFNKSKSDGYPGAVCKFQHSDLAILGAVASGTLRLNVDDVGLSYECDLPNTSAGSDVAELVGRGDIAYSSMAFQVYDDSWGYEDGQPLRTLLSGRLIDVSPVSQPAYRSTSVALRSLARAVGAPIEDVIDYAESDQLAKFFTRPLSGRQAYLATLAKAHPRLEPSKPMTGRQAQLHLLAKKHPQPSKPLSPRQRQVQVLGKKWGPGDW